MNKVCAIAFVIAAIVYGNKIQAQESGPYEGINSDRPGQSFSATNLNKGQLSLQSGVLFPLNSIVDKNLTKNSYTLSTFIRYGLLKRLEIGLGTGVSMYEFLLNDVENYQVFLPSASVRGQLLFEQDFVPAVGLHLDYTRVGNINEDDIDIAFRDISRQAGNEFRLRLSLAKTLNENFSVAININRQIFSNSEDVESKDVPINYTFNIGYSHINFGTFLEMYGSFQKSVLSNNPTTFYGGPNPQNKERLLNFDTGFWYQISPRTRLDITLGRNNIGYRGRGTDDLQYYGDIGATVLLN